MEQEQTAGAPQSATEQQQQQSSSGNTLTGLVQQHNPLGQQQLGLQQLFRERPKSASDQRRASSPGNRKTRPRKPLSKTNTVLSPLERRMQLLQQATNQLNGSSSTAAGAGIITASGTSPSKKRKKNKSGAASVANAALEFLQEHRMTRQQQQQEMFGGPDSAKDGGGNSRPSSRAGGNTNNPNAADAATPRMISMRESARVYNDQQMNGFSSSSTGFHNIHQHNNATGGGSDFPMSASQILLQKNTKRNSGSKSWRTRSDGFQTMLHNKEEKEQRTHHSTRNRHQSDNDISDAESEDSQTKKQEEARELLATWRKLQREKPYQIANLRWGGNRQSDGYKALMARNDFVMGSSGAAGNSNSNQKNSSDRDLVNNAANQIRDFASDNYQGTNLTKMHNFGLGQNPQNKIMNKGTTTSSSKEKAGASYWKFINSRRPSSAMRAKNANGNNGNSGQLNNAYDLNNLSPSHHVLNPRPRSGGGNNGNSSPQPKKKKKKKKLLINPDHIPPETDQFIPVGMSNDPVDLQKQKERLKKPREKPPPIFSMPAYELDANGMIKFVDGDESVLFEQNPHLKEALLREQMNSPIGGSSGVAMGTNGNAVGGTLKLRRKKSLSKEKLTAEQAAASTAATIGAAIQKNQGHQPTAQEMLAEMAASAAGYAAKRAAKMNSSTFDGHGNLIEIPPPPPPNVAYLGQNSANLQNQILSNKQTNLGSEHTDLRKALGRKFSRSILNISAVGTMNGATESCGEEGENAGPLSLETAAEKILSNADKPTLLKKQRSKEFSGTSIKVEKQDSLTNAVEAELSGGAGAISSSSSSKENPTSKGATTSKATAKGAAGYFDNKQDQLNQSTGSFLFYDGNSTTTAVEQQHHQGAVAINQHKSTTANKSSQLHQQLSHPQHAANHQVSLETVPSIFVVPEERWEPKSTKLQKKMEKKRRQREKEKMNANWGSGGAQSGVFNAAEGTTGDQENGFLVDAQNNYPENNSQTASGQPSQKERPAVRFSEHVDSSIEDANFTNLPPNNPTLLDVAEGGKSVVPVPVASAKGLETTGSFSVVPHIVTGSSTGGGGQKAEQKSSRKSSKSKKSSSSSSKSSKNNKSSSSMRGAKVEEPKDYLDKAMAYGLDLYRVLRDTTNEDLAEWCLNNPMVAKNSHIYILGQLHYSKYDAINMAKVFRRLQPHIVGLEAPLDGRETWKGLADAFRREALREDFGLHFLNEIARKAKTEKTDKSVLSICNSFPVAMPKYLAGPSCRILHIDSNRQLALQACELLKQQSLAHYLRIVCDLSDTELDRLVQLGGGGSSGNSNSAPVSSAQKHQARQLQENKTAELSYDIVPTHRLAFILREVALKTEPKNTSDIIFHRREESMASTLVGFDGRVLAVVGCQHIAGLQKELEKLGYSNCNTAADARGN
ncbi:unnamed protein product [Amoebophrya sp. A120]|nr:unnamed protein product [Amoebophrya sp. A120]|eukprot:GSA120T00016261001.1